MSCRSKRRDRRARRSDRPAVRPGQPGPAVSSRPRARHRLRPDRGGRRQPRLDALRGILCGLLRGQPGRGVLRPHYPSPAQPGRQSGSQPCAVAHGHGPPQPRQDHPGLLRTTTDRRPQRQRDHPLPQAIRRLGDLPAAHRPARHRRRSRPPPTPPPSQAPPSGSSPNPSAPGPSVSPNSNAASNTTAISPNDTPLGSTYTQRRIDASQEQERQLPPGCSQVFSGRRRSARRGWDWRLRRLRGRRASWYA
jgi:hypothetical protein